ncbi:MAG: hypothetical protein HGA78_08430 [Nitrospirales bacterium]|nr:hypothetical protein [Nitrospirales bacterium]
MRSKEKAMLSVKQAVERIKEQFNDLFGSDITDIRLEEIEQSTNDEIYNLTVSFLVPNKNISPTITSIMGGITNPFIRQYKTVLINKENGNIVKIKIHKDA